MRNDRLIGILVLELADVLDGAFLT